MTRIITREEDPARWAAGVAACGTIRRALWPFRDDPVAAWILGLGPRPANVPVRDEAATEAEESRAA